MLQRVAYHPPIRQTAIAGALAMASAMGFGRFVFTPILPGMVAGVPISTAAAGYIASANFIGYLLGAVLASLGWGAGRERQVAIAALCVSTAMLAAMGLTESVAAYLVIRFVAGLASAYAMIFTTSIVLGHARANGHDGAQAVHFGGVGFGITLSSLLVYLGALAEGSGAAAWRIDWFVSAAITLLMLMVVWRLLPPAVPRAVCQPDREPPIRWQAPLSLTTLSYGLFGFGYVITATFIVTMARMGDAGPFVEFFTWFVTGVLAALSISGWAPLVRRFGPTVSYPLALLLAAIGVLGSISLPSPLAPIVGGGLLGATFMAITAHGLRIGQMLAPESPRRTLGVMTAAFGLGQILGPLVAGYAAEATGSFTLASLLGALALIAAMICFLLVRRRIG